MKLDYQEYYVPRDKFDPIKAYNSAKIDFNKPVIVSTPELEITRIICSDKKWEELYYILKQVQRNPEFKSDPRIEQWLEALKALLKSS